MSVITAEDIRASGARTIPDALRLVPGVDVADLTQINYAVCARGSNGYLSGDLLVLVDGRQIYDSLFGGTLWGAWPFQLEDIDHIEVIRGPGGVIWGANAVNGVINIITKDPAKQLGLSLTIGAGSRGWNKEHIGYAAQDGKARYRVSAEYESADGFVRGGSFLQSLDDDFKTGRLGLHAIYDLNETDALTLSLGSALTDGGTPTAPLAGLRQAQTSGFEANFILAKWTRTESSDHAHEVVAYLNDFRAVGGSRPLDYRYEQLGVQYAETRAVTDEHTVTWGVDTRFDLLDTGNAEPFLTTEESLVTGILGVYLHDQWRFAPRWALDLGGRVDYEFYGGWQPSARGALSYQLGDDTFLYGALSRAFQVPPSGLRYINMPMLNGLAFVTADANVDIISLLAAECGYRTRFGDRLEANVNLYWHEYDDTSTTSMELGPPGLVQMRHDNRGSTSLYGVEFDTQYKVSADLTLLGNYTYQQLNWTSDVSFLDTDSLTPPAHKAMLGLRYRVTDQLHLSSHAYYVDAADAPNPSNPFAAKHIDPYVRLDLVGEYSFWRDQASVAVGVRNLFDDHHPEGSSSFINDAEVPRMVFAELRVRIP